jgi:hypothetical protein
MSMNNPNPENLANFSLLLMHNGLADGRRKDLLYREIVTRLVRWEIALPHNQAPKKVILDVFRRNIRREVITLPSDRVERKLSAEIDWGQKDDEEDLFTI